MREDQASGLRRLFAPRSCRSFSVAGVDATPVVCDLARAFAALSSRVLIIDRTRGEAAAGFATRARFELAQVIAGDRGLRDVLIDATPSIAVLPAARGLDELALGAVRIEGGWQAQLRGWLDDAQLNFDVWLINGLPPQRTGADVLLAVDPTPKGMTGAYAQIKALAQFRGQRSFRLVVHRASSEASARATFDRIATTARRFLHADLDYRGAIPVDAAVGGARQLALTRLAQSLRPTCT